MKPCIHLTVTRSDGHCSDVEIKELAELWIQQRRGVKEES